MLQQGYGRCLAGFHARAMQHRSVGKWKDAVGLSPAWAVKFLRLPLMYPGIELDVPLAHAPQAVRLEDMKLHQIWPSSVTYALIMTICRQSNEWRWPLQLLASLRLGSLKSAVCLLCGCQLRLVEHGPFVNFL